MRKLFERKWYAVTGKLFRHPYDYWLEFDGGFSLSMGHRYVTPDKEAKGFYSKSYWVHCSRLGLSGGVAFPRVLGVVEAQIYPDHARFYYAFSAAVGMPYKEYEVSSIAEGIALLKVRLLIEHGDML